jgi:hypothetical protein
MSSSKVTPLDWKRCFFETATSGTHSQPLKEAALTKNNQQWTQELTCVAVETCKRVGWLSAAKGHKLSVLPESRHEYLGIDVMAFPAEGNNWRFPISAIELENSSKEDRIAYSLWKVLSIRTQLRIVFCYRPEQEDAPKLIRYLKDSVVNAIAVSDMLAINGETLVVVGNRNNADTFPFGFFKWWQLDRNTHSFELFN